MRCRCAGGRRSTTGCCPAPWWRSRRSNNPDPVDATPLLIFLAKISGARYYEPSSWDARRPIAAFFGKHLKDQ